MFGNRSRLGLYFQNVAKFLSNVFELKFISLWLYNEADSSLALRSFYPSSIDLNKIGFEEFDNKVLDCRTSLSGETFFTKEIKTYTDIQTSDKFQNKAFAKKFGLNWFISFPIFDSDQKPVGIVNICPQREKEYFDIETQNTIPSYLSSLAPRIKRAGIMDFDSLLKTFDNIFKSMIEIRDQKISWDKLALLVSNEMKCEACSIFLLEKNDLLYLKGSTGIVDNPPYENIYYNQGEGLTYYAFQQKQPLIYYPEFEERFREFHLNKHKEILKTSKKKRSIVFVNINDDYQRPIGIIRCINKEDTPSRHGGRFTKEDIINLRKISELVSNLYLKVLWINERDKERERNVNSLYHEILSPVEGIGSHIEWMEDHWKRYPLPLRGI